LKTTAALRLTRLFFDIHERPRWARTKTTTGVFIMTKAHITPPDFIAFQVRESKSKSYFNRVGIAFTRKDQMGINIILESLPLNGRITLRAVEAAETSE
jgi:hypothetical protein